MKGRGGVITDKGVRKSQNVYDIIYVWSPTSFSFSGHGGRMSPLTPERNKTPNIVRGDVSPLTPPLPAAREPRPPPPPPPPEEVIN